MAKHLNISRINELKNNAHDNIESYNDPDTPNALAKFTSQIRAILLADPGMLDSVPEYLPVALYDRVKFSPESKRQWAHWISLNIHPSWDEFKTSIAFNNADLPLALAVRKYSEDLLIESCAVVYLLETQGESAPKQIADEDDSDGLHEHERDENDDDNDYDSDEEGYYDQYDEDIE
ncbi:hypothetical protein EGC79_04265 [Shewanella vesiculosa]|uniref:cold adaptation protein AtcA n=1 Tax=Shewanella vesiculosa TaxID=518738 RepID=UPI000F4E20FA|nr:hypothetical protein [Shewanella vesiculosa]RPA55676.1 hypothetical protein EGC79_04265 [Shewanella vesiculosa]UJL41315.1 hypothetical protein KDH10_002260 [Shewanella vesiculosa]